MHVEVAVQKAAATIGVVHVEYTNPQRNHERTIRVARSHIACVPYIHLPTLTHTLTHTYRFR